ncbi:MAG: hypothetical protein NTZ32_12505 [Planctomycetales bacterium]|nr:hypothetical protein [Planctomycetales bacterium]
MQLWNPASTFLFACVLITFALGRMTTSAWAAAPDADALLSSGSFNEGVAALEAHLKVEPKDDVARLGLGVTQFVSAVQRLGQSMAVYGPQQPNFILWPTVVPSDVPAPAEPLTYPTLRQINQEWLDDLAKIDATLAKLTSEEIKLPLHVGRVTMNLGTAETRSLTLLPVLRQFQLTQNGREADFVIVFDRADVDWLRGYCHLLSALSEIMLAYDGQELFDISAHRLFQHAVIPHPFLLEPNRSPVGGWFQFEEIADAVAIIHMLRFPLVEPKRMPVALAHIEQTLSLSRQMWKRIQAETDNDREWIPGPKQKGAINVAVTQEMLDNWMLALTETEQIVQGKKLLPFWRGKPTRGVNLRKAFLEPRQLDIVLWVQGTAATPYLEEGELTKPDTWQQINRAFGGQFVGFGMWFN